MQTEQPFSDLPSCFFAAFAALHIFGTQTDPENWEDLGSNAKCLWLTMPQARKLAKTVGGTP